MFCLAAVLLCSFPVGSVWAGKAVKAVVLLSRNIRPYAEAVEGLSHVLEKQADIGIRLFHHDKYEEDGIGILREKIENEKTDVFIAMGPEAAVFMANHLGNVSFPKMYTMVLNPERLGESVAAGAGIPMNIPVRTQVMRISGALPSVKRLGLLHDPDFNNAFFREALENQADSGVEIVPLRAENRKRIPEVLRENWDRIDALWLIPDKTVIRETIVKNLIMKEAIIKKMPVIGYNRIFYRQGAVVAFVLDYEELGRQTGEMAIDALAGQASETRSPRFKVWLNHRVMKRLGKTFPAGISGDYEAGP